MGPLPQGIKSVTSLRPSGRRYAQAWKAIAAAPPVRRPRRRRCTFATTSAEPSWDALAPAGFPAANGAAIRNGDWKIAPLPADLLDRRVEITGPVGRKMMISALDSGAEFHG